MSKSITTSVVPFQFENYSIRSINRDGEIWFVAADVCSALHICNPTMALKNLDADEAALSLIEGSFNGAIQKREINVISESGLYTVILRCRDAIKKGTVPYRFRRWVTSEVLP